MGRHGTGEPIPTAVWTEPGHSSKEGGSLFAQKVVTVTENILLGYAADCQAELLLLCSVHAWMSGLFRMGSPTAVTLNRRAGFGLESSCGYP